MIIERPSRPAEQSSGRIDRPKLEGLVIPQPPRTPAEQAAPGAGPQPPAADPVQERPPTISEPNNPKK